MRRIQSFLLRTEIADRLHAAVAPEQVGVALRGVDIGYVKDNRIEAHNALRDALDAKADTKEEAELRSVELKVVGAEANAAAAAAADSKVVTAAAAVGNLKPAAEEVITVMRNVTLSVRAGETLAIVGAVGSGKSAIVDAVLGEARVLCGAVDVRGSVAYLPQNPWVQSGTVRDNILFGKPFVRARYEAAIHACALWADLAILPKGDLTLCAERGMNLSGGQRQRLSLARAVYADAQVYVLDGPLSAVDWHTSNHIMTHCFKGLLRGKTIVLVTHQLHLLAQFDRIAIVKHKTVSYFGAFSDDVMRREFPEFQAENERVRAQVNAGTGPAGTTAATAATAATATAPTAATTVAIAGGATSPAASTRLGGGEPDADPLAFERYDDPYLNTKAAGLTDGKERDTRAALVATQHTASGTGAAVSATPPAKTAASASDVAEAAHASFGAWKAWATAGGFTYFLCAFHAFNWAQTSRIMSDWFLSQWTAGRWGLAQLTYEYVYVALVAVFGVFIVARGTLMYGYSVRTATKLHNDMYARILAAPFWFFTVKPLGGVLNAFSKDQDVIDEQLPDTWHMTTIYANILMTTVILVAVTLPIYAAMIVLLIACLVAATYYYLSTTVQLKALVTDTATPLLAQFTETLTGISVVRAFDAQLRFQTVNERLIDRAHTTTFTLEQVQYWLGYRMDLLSQLLVFVSAVLCVAYRTTISASATGLVISSSLQMLLFFTWVVRGMADIASLMTSVQRVHNYTTQTPQEEVQQTKAVVDATSGQQTALVAVPKPTPPEAWPSRGSIEFRNVTMRYLPGAPPALRNVSFTIRAGEKVGVVGRTGSGKTSLVMTLFRLAEAETDPTVAGAGGAADVLVDGESTAQYTLEDVRSRLAIIPQEPVLFKGTIRSNLDPFHRATDAQIWEALALVYMGDTVRASPAALHTAVEDNGHNFSLGQRQLLCLARAKLNRSRVLVLDEASSALDLHTDQLVQATIKRAFSDRTVITIAHRLDTVIASDRILAMANGRVVEFDTPAALLADPNSFFSKLLDNAGQHRDTLRAAVFNAASVWHCTPV